MIASNRRTLPVLFVPAGAVAGLVMIAGASGVAFGGPNEPLPSPISTIQGEVLRSIALDIRDEQGGLIVVHTDFRDQMTWPFRDSGDVILAKYAS